MFWLGREVQSRIDYTLVMYRHLFRNVSVRDLRHKSDHYFILGCLQSAILREHTTYI